MKISQRLFSVLMVVLLSACGGSSDSNEGDPNIFPSDNNNSPLNKLLGRVSFTYSFNNSSNVYTGGATFTKIEKFSDGDEYVLDSAQNVFCSYLITSGTYFCLHERSDKSTELFLFNMTSTTIGSGIYEYCDASETAETCTSDLANTPDGKVTVNVSRASVRSAVKIPQNMQLIEHDVDTYLQADELQSASDGGHAKTVDFDAVLNKLESFTKAKQ